MADSTLDGALLSGKENPAMASASPSIAAPAVAIRPEGFAGGVAVDVSAAPAVETMARRETERVRETIRERKWKGKMSCSETPTTYT